MQVKLQNMMGKFKVVYLTIQIALRYTDLHTFAIFRTDNVTAHVRYMPNEARISIKDIARAAGVSHSTVSRSLSDSPLVNPETKARIQQLSHEMGYTPNAAARSLVMRADANRGRGRHDDRRPIHRRSDARHRKHAYEHGYTVILASSNSDPAREVAAVEMLRSSVWTVLFHLVSRGAHCIRITLSESCAVCSSTITASKVGATRFRSRGQSTRRYLATQHLIELDIAASPSSRPR